MEAALRWWARSRVSRPGKRGEVYAGEYCGAHREMRTEPVVPCPDDRSQERAHADADDRTQEPDPPEERLAQNETDGRAIDCLCERHAAHDGSLDGEPRNARRDARHEAPDRNPHGRAGDVVPVEARVARNAPQGLRHAEHEHELAKQQYGGSEVDRPHRDEQRVHRRSLSVSVRVCSRYDIEGEIALGDVRIDR